MARRLPAFPSAPAWIHGASVGEARITRGLAAEIKKRRPGQALAVSAVTPTGRAQLPAPPSVEGAFFCPLDLPRIQSRAFETLAPAMVVLIETELWPNLLSEAASRRVPVVLVNARLAPERVGRYRFLSALYRPLISSIEAIGVPGGDEAARFVSLGVAESKLAVTGNVKFDLPAPSVTAAELRARFGVAAERPVVAAGSTGAGEDAIVLDAFEQARREIPSLLLVLAPRHPDRFAPAEEEVLRRGLAVGRVSTGRPLGSADVLLVDTVGELASLYALATSAFVGGSLVRVGGHNLLEPLSAGAPVLFGPHTEHVAELAAIVTAAGCGERVNDAAALGRAWVRLASDRAERGRRIALGQQVLSAHRGALARSVDLILSVLDRARASRTE